MKLSVIVPAYKVEDYIAACLESLLDQGLAKEDYEIIVIDDGSPDSSKAIATDYARQHSNIIVVDQENQGVSVARNRGLELAQGDYIAFVDPDDTIYPNAFPPILKRAYDDNLDLLYLSLEVYNEKGELLLTAEKNGNDDVVMEGFDHPRRTFLSTLYKRSVIGNTRYVKGIIRGQDTVFNVMVQANAKTCSYCSLPYYKYLQRESSSRQFVGTEKNFISTLFAIETISNYQKKNFPDPAEPQRRYFDQAMLIFIQRTLEWNIFPQSNKKNFYALKQRLSEMGLDYLIPATAEKFPMFDKSFTTFMSYHRLKGVYRKMRNIFTK